MEKQREIPFGIRLQLLLGGVTSIIGIVFFLMGSLFLFIFGSNVDFQSHSFDENSPKIQGQIVEVEATGMSENDRIIYCYHFQYQASNGLIYRNQSYSFYDENLTKGSIVNIEYLPQKPNVSRIETMRCQPFDMWLILLLLIFPIIGGSFLVWNIVQGLKRIHLLTYGITTFGTVINKIPTNMRINKQTVYEVFFQFEDNTGKKYRASTKTHEYDLLEDEPQEPLVYLPTNPENAVLIDALPRSVRTFLGIDFQFTT